MTTCCGQNYMFLNHFQILNLTCVHFYQSQRNAPSTSKIGNPTTKTLGSVHCTLCVTFCYVSKLQVIFKKTCDIGFALEPVISSMLIRSNEMQQYAGVYLLQNYMFRVSIAPIIRSTSNCNCSFWYRSYHVSEQQPSHSVAQLVHAGGRLLL